jgi:hypothetical protein
LTTTDNPAAWNLELSRTGQVRFPLRRRRLAWRLGVFVFALTSPVLSVIAAARGDRPWGSWEAFSVLALPIFMLMIAYTGWSLWTGRPMLVVDQEAVAIGRKRLTWQEIRSIELPRSSRWQLVPRRLAIDFVTVVPFEARRRRQIAITNDYADRVEGLGTWLADLLQRRQHPVGESSPAASVADEVADASDDAQ